MKKILDEQRLRELAGVVEEANVAKTQKLPRGWKPGDPMPDPPAPEDLEAPTSDRSKTTYELTPERAAEIASRERGIAQAVAAQRDADDVTRSIRDQPRVPLTAVTQAVGETGNPIRGMFKHTHPDFPERSITIPRERPSPIYQGSSLDPWPEEWTPEQRRLEWGKPIQYWLDLWAAAEGDEDKEESAEAEYQAAIQLHKNLGAPTGRYSDETAGVAGGEVPIALPPEGVGTGEAGRRGRPYAGEEGSSEEYTGAPVMTTQDATDLVRRLKGKRVHRATTPSRRSPAHRQQEVKHLKEFVEKMVETLMTETQ